MSFPAHNPAPEEADATGELGRALLYLISLAFPMAAGAGLLTVAGMGWYESWVPALVYVGFGLPLSIGLRLLAEHGYHRKVFSRGFVLSVLIGMVLALVWSAPPLRIALVESGKVERAKRGLEDSNDDVSGAACARLIELDDSPGSFAAIAERVEGRRLSECVASLDAETSRRFSAFLLRELHRAARAGDIECSDVDLVSGLSAAGSMRSNVLWACTIGDANAEVRRCCTAALQALTAESPTTELADSVELTSRDIRWLVTAAFYPSTLPKSELDAVRGLQLESPSGREDVLRAICSFAGASENATVLLDTVQSAMQASCPDIEFESVEALRTSHLNSLCLEAPARWCDEFATSLTIEAVEVASRTVSAALSAYRSGSYTGAIESGTAREQAAAKDPLTRFRRMEERLETHDMSDADRRSLEAVRGVRRSIEYESQRDKLHHRFVRDYGRRSEE